MSKILFGVTEVCQVLICFCIGLTVGGCVRTPETATQSQKQSATNSIQAHTLDPLNNFLRKNPSLRMVTYEDIGLFWQQLVKPSEVITVDRTDANGDGINDVVAVLVRDGTHKTYSVVVFNGTSEGYPIEPQWIVKDHVEQILGVSVEGKYITPFFCYGCDANPVYRWSGFAYENGIHIVDEAACVSPGTKVFKEPFLSDVIASVPNSGGEARVLKLGPKGPGGYRWHQVIVTTHTNSFTGWITGNAFIDQPGYCY